MELFILDCCLVSDVMLINNATADEHISDCCPVKRYLRSDLAGTSWHSESMVLHWLDNKTAMATGNSEFNILHIIDQIHNRRQ